MMNKTIFAVSVLLSVMVASVSGLDRLYTFCSDKESYESQDRFGTNLNRILGDLSSNIMRNGTLYPGFYNSSIENEQDEVFGQALCRGDVFDPKTCQSCVQIASQEILRNCSTRDAFIWYDLCLVRYSFQKFFSLMTYTGKYPEGDHVKSQVLVDPARFGEYLNDLMSRIVEETVLMPSNRMFATGKVGFSRDQTVYGLAQCTLDLTPDLCRNCLLNALGDLRGCCSSRQGGFIVSRTCALRFELYQFYNDTSKFYSTPNGNGKRNSRRILIAIIASASLLAILLFSWAVFVLQRKKRKILDRDMINEQELLRELAISQTAITISEEGKLLTSEELPFVDLTSVRAATDDFAISNKIGQGGFGTVYKGVFEDGKEVAVKRLSRKSWQGLEEFKNEVILIAKLQHRNLVRLVGCSQGDEKLLLYEFMPNRSLDFFIFDSERRSTLNWGIYYNIIVGISKGLLYLHEDSRPRIIHRDLKPSNVLLDHDMVAKISDFGMARIFCDNQNSANTKRVVGTFGYMAPEYAMGGIFSVKSDVYSFGVILLEIISGKKNNGFYLTEHAQTLLSYAWKLWKEEKEYEFVDPLLIGLSSCPKEDIKRCIHIGLLCVQENPVDRPTMTDVVMLLPGSESIICSLPEPKEPAFSIGRASPSHLHSPTDPTVSDVLPR